jgi:hypothetical protein
MLDVVVGFAAFENKEEKTKADAGAEHHRNFKRSGTEDEILDGDIQDQK